MKIQLIQFLLAFTIFTTIVKQSDGNPIIFVSWAVAVVGLYLIDESYHGSSRQGSSHHAPSPDTTPPRYLGDFAVCNGASSVRDFGRRVDVRPIKKFWENPKAEDDVSNPTDVVAPSLPEEFGQGQHEYEYYATDSAPSPNKNICRVRFFVEVKTCKILEPPINGFLDCQRIADSLTVGTICRYSCEEGFKLQGASHLECKGTPTAVSWTPQPEPICTTACHAGHYVDLSNDTNPQCTPCPLNTFLDIDVHQKQECIPCAPGMITIKKGSSKSTDCFVVCQPGTYLESSSCIPCPLDTYQDQTNHREESCIPCPGNLVTFDERSGHRADCAAVCNAGHYVDLSNENNPQCSPCPRNTFLDLDVHQKQECIPCVPGMITIQDGSSQSTDCLVVCQPGTYLESSSCIPCPLNTYQDQTNHREESCIPCPGNLVTGDESSENLADCTGISFGQILCIVFGAVVLIITGPIIVVVRFC